MRSLARTVICTPTGFRGIKFVLEPGVAYVDYPSASGLEPQWFLGGSAGFDLSSIFGIRGFYYSATKTPGTLDFNLNNELRMYGVTSSLV